MAKKGNPKAIRFDPLVEKMAWQCRLLRGMNSEDMRIENFSEYLHNLIKEDYKRQVALTSEDEQGNSYVDPD
jgi:hypothetical protein